MASSNYITSSITLNLFFVLRPYRPYRHRLVMLNNLISIWLMLLLYVADLMLLFFNITLQTSLESISSRKLMNTRFWFIHNSQVYNSQVYYILLPLCYITLVSYKYKSSFRNGTRQIKKTIHVNESSWV